MPVAKRLPIIQRRLEPLPMPPFYAYSRRSLGILSQRPVLRVPGIYFVYDESLRCLYIGKSNSIDKRVRQHPWIKQSYFVAWLEFPSSDQDELLYAESYYTLLLRPVYRNSGLNRLRSGESLPPESTFG